MKRLMAVSLIAGLVLAASAPSTSAHHRYRHPTPYHVLASWYYDYSLTASGFHAYYGVANKVLPFGTKVKFGYNGHHVTGVVDDRGPYVYPRVYDLDQNLARALGFTGVGKVWASKPGT